MFVIARNKPISLDVTTGTVTSVGLAAPTIFTVSGSPVTAAGTLTLTLANQGANTVFAGPTSGGAAVPAFRALVAADIPQIPIATGISGLGTGIAVALAIAIGSAGAPVVFNGAGGTPSSLTGTNITGIAAGLTAGNVTTNANLTGPITSVGNATSLAAQTGTGSVFVVQNTPTLTTPVLGIATATSINGNTITTGTGTLTIAAGKTLTQNNSITHTGTDGTTVTYPTTNATLARTDAAQTFTGVQTLSSQPILSSLTASQAVFTDGSKGLVSNAITGTGNVVMSASPTFTGTITAATATFSNKIGIGTTSPGTVNGVSFSTVLVHVKGTGGSCYMAVDDANNAGFVLNDSSQAVDSRLWFNYITGAIYAIAASTDAGIPTNLLTLTRSGNVTLTGSITTADPGSGSGDWKLGTGQAGAGFTLKTTEYAEISIAGVVKKLALIN